MTFNVEVDLLYRQSLLVDAEDIAEAREKAVDLARIEGGSCPTFLIDSPQVVSVVQL